MPKSELIVPISSTRRGGVWTTKLREIYLCEICGNKVKVLDTGLGKLVCYGQPMKLVKA